MTKNSPSNRFGKLPTYDGFPESHLHGIAVARDLIACWESGDKDTLAYRAELELVLDDEQDSESAAFALGYLSGFVDARSVEAGRAARQCETLRTKYDLIVIERERRLALVPDWVFALFKTYGNIKKMLYKGRAR